MAQEDCSNQQKSAVESLIEVHEYYLQKGLSLDELQNVVFAKEYFIFKKSSSFLLCSAILVLLILCIFSEDSLLLNFILGIRCIVPNNYFIWEATRPTSDCSFCSNVTEPIVLHNVTREEFKPYSYSSKPIIVKGAFLHWPALKRFSWQFFKDLYASIEGSHRTVDEECQFLHFKSDFISIKDVFSMKDARVKNLRGEKSWYVGWGNCHPRIIQEMRKFYPKPHFLPHDAEIPYSEYVFMGYDDGATMHVDFINRLMWQAQLQGSKIWNLLPPPECQNKCKPVTFLVQPGDGVLVDTRIWYHATTIPNGEFSLSVQSEYG